ncbi:cation diffusion facilitator family transporter [Paenibacillus tarimensis]|uniref:cation diffusion facilitator family transporter n=1 Tax=Paenibacillus tarimensis TaxID=416012 RepID=UPI001F30CA3E|nr:cation diffusion facilitator family transporter [Paenibacillus tarimensis]MCF2945495.1 cation diffusion facilitator family transporter [Paenibacillus tarimensis]
MPEKDYHHISHRKEQTRTKKTLWITLILTLIFTIVEIIGGLLSNSLALLSDSAHMISDVLALGLSMTAIYMATRKPNGKYTFGYVRFETIASFLNGLALVIIAGGIFIQGIYRLIRPEPIDIGLMLGIATIGLLVNVVLTIVLSRSMKEENNLNVQSALWHFIGDLLSSVGVIVSAVIIYFTGVLLFDPLISMVIGGIIAAGGFRIVQESYRILMDTVPDHLKLEEIRQAIAEVEGVRNVHDMHVWTIATDQYSLTAHVFVQQDIQPMCVTLAICELLKDQYGIAHSTIQIEHPLLHDHGTFGKEQLKVVS